jgi:hypothetical protein
VGYVTAGSAVKRPLPRSACFRFFSLSVLCRVFQRRCSRSSKDLPCSLSLSLLLSLSHSHTHTHTFLAPGAVMSSPCQSLPPHTHTQAHTRTHTHAQTHTFFAPGAVMSSPCQSLPPPLFFALAFLKLLLSTFVRGFRISVTITYSRCSEHYDTFL